MTKNLPAAAAEVRSSSEAPAGQVAQGASPAGRGGRPARGESARQMRRFMLTTALAFILVLAFLVLAVERVTTESLVRTEEHANINLTLLIANALAERFDRRGRGQNIFADLALPKAGNVRAAPHFAELNEVIRGYVKGTSVFRVKMYGRNGETLFSTDSAQIGVVNPFNQAVMSAFEGKVVSQLVHRDSFSIYDREVSNIDMVQSYIPGVGVGTGTEGLVFEVYSDVTRELSDLQSDQRQMFIILGLAMLVLYLALHLLVWGAQSLLEQKSIERDRAYQRMAEAELELAQRKARFVAAAAHELRTPMTTIRGYSELLRDRPMDPAQQRDMAEAINQQAEGMSQLLDELLELSQFDEQGQAALRFRRQPLGPLVRAVVADAAALGLSGGQIQVDIAPDLPEVNIDAERIRQVLANLLSNAFKYSDPGSPVSVSVGRDQRAGRPGVVGLRVKDSGCGILPEEMPYLFDRFWRSPRVVAIRGTGLGMSIVKSLVELHEGSIEVESASGEGTTVTIWLPEAEACQAGRKSIGGEAA